MGKTRVMIVDDHPIMRQGLRQLLSREPDLEIHAEAGDLKEALALFQEVRPELVILDVSLPDGSGLDLAKRFRAIDHDVRMLFVSMHEDAIFAERALRAEANGYINKSRPAGEFLEAVRKVLDGQIALSQHVSDRLLRRALGTAPTDAPSMDNLSDRELEVLEFIGRGLSTRDIAEKLKLSVKTIETHREHIKKKLALHSGTELTRYATLWSQQGGGTGGIP